MGHFFKRHGVCVQWLTWFEESVGLVGEVLQFVDDTLFGVEFISDSADYPVDALVHCGPPFGTVRWLWFDVEDLVDAHGRSAGDEVVFLAQFECGVFEDECAGSIRCW